MSKEAYYFSHDSNARNDEKIIELRMIHDWSGYGIYWAIIEMLRDSETYTLKKKLKSLAFELRTSEEVIKSIIEDFDLFDFNEFEFWSNSLKTRMEIKNKKSKKMSEIASKRWEKTGRLKDEVRHDSPQAYIIHCYNDNEEFFKIGHTNTTISRRYSGKLPYDYNVYKQFFSANAIDIENQIQDALCGFEYNPKIKFAGSKECYNINAFKMLKDIEVTEYKVLKDNTNSFAMRRNAKSMHRNAIKGKERKGKESKVDEINAIYDLFVQEVKQNNHQEAIQQMYMRLKIKSGTLTPLLKDFKGQLIIDEKVHTKTLEFRKHFFNWLNSLDRIGKLNQYKKQKAGAL